MFVGGGNTLWSRTVTQVTPGFVSIEITRTQQTSGTNANTMTRCNEKRNVATQDHGMWQTTTGEAHCATSTIARLSLSPPLSLPLQSPFVVPCLLLLTGETNPSKHIHGRPKRTKEGRRRATRIPRQRPQFVRGSTIVACRIHIQNNKVTVDVESTVSITSNTHRHVVVHRSLRILDGNTEVSEQFSSYTENESVA